MIPPTVHAINRDAKRKLGRKNVSSRKEERKIKHSSTRRTNKFRAKLDTVSVQQVDEGHHEAHVKLQRDQFEEQCLRQWKNFKIQKAAYQACFDEYDACFPALA